MIGVIEVDGQFALTNGVTTNRRRHETRAKAEQIADRINKRVNNPDAMDVVRDQQRRQAQLDGEEVIKQRRMDEAVVQLLSDPAMLRRIATSINRLSEAVESCELSDRGVSA